METTDLGKWNHLARYQESLRHAVVVCRICPHNCRISDGKYGLCKARINREGKLYCTTYGNPCSMAVDPIEKKPLFHFYPGARIFSVATSGCNFRCLNCQNWHISQANPQDINQYNMQPADLVEYALNQGMSMIAFTYTEPTVFYEYVYDTSEIAHRKGLKTVLISNGYINREPLLALCPLIDAANIDLKCFDDVVYRKLTGGRLQSVLDTLITLRSEGVWLEITNLIIPTLTDNPETITEMCNWLVANGFDDTPLHFSRFFPTYKLSDLMPTPADTLISACEIAVKAGMMHVYTGNLHTMQGDNTHCTHCNQLLVERQNYHVVQNNIHGSRCSFCGQSVAGVWE
jgi:pyruvate formate lyase activating enzyme